MACSSGAHRGPPRHQPSRHQLLTLQTQDSPRRRLSAREAGLASMKLECQDESSREERIERVPLLMGERVRIDDEDNLYVIVFPRQQKGHGGTVDHKAVREEPKADWERIFPQPGKKGKKEKPPDILRHGVPEATYQEVVREHVKLLLKESGLKAKSKESIDGDEVFLKISIDADGPMIRRLAEAFQYQMPFREKCYKDEEGFGSYHGGRPMLNANGDAVPAYADYSSALADKLQPFQRIDQIRLVTKQIDSCMSLAEMEKQNVISRHFPGASYDCMKQLNAHWAGLANILNGLPDKLHDDNIRSYFGEEIAFFFQWVGQYARNLSWMAAIGVLFFVFEHSPLQDSNLEAQDRFKVLFGILVIIWETYFHHLFRADTARAAQRWGMEGFERLENVLPTYDPNLEGTPRLRTRKWLTTGAMVVYLGLFFWLVKLVNERLPKWILPWIQTALVKFLSFVWRKIVFHLVTLENHRTQSRWNQAMLRYLSIVKLTLSLCPFVYIAFIVWWYPTKCGDTLPEVANSLYTEAGKWPKGIDDKTPLERLLESYHFHRDDEVCIYGCYPVACDGRGDCQTNCMDDLQTQLLTLYLGQLFAAIVCLAIPVVTTHWAVHKEMRKAQSRNGGNDRFPYSLLDLQNKCHEWAAYEFSHWGGSHVEDFIDVVVPYALLACFGVCYPQLAIWGCFCMVVQYRLLAFRMTNVTCRPMPRRAKGIGHVQEVMEVISYVALTLNVSIVVFLLEPVRGYTTDHKIALFILLEQAAFFLRRMFSYVTGSIPDDVILIGDFNAEFEKKLKDGNHKKWYSGDTMCDYDKVDFRLFDRPSEQDHRAYASEPGSSEASDEDACC